MLYARSHDRLTCAAPRVDGVGVWQLLGHSGGQDTLRDAFAWVIAHYCNPCGAPFIPALGLDYGAFADLLHARFPHFSPQEDWLAAQNQPVGKGGALDEFPDLLQLLLQANPSNDSQQRLVAHLVATACMGSNHLWQDLGLPGRGALSTLLARHFPALTARNTNDMKWKKFFYRQLCERDGYVACNRPSCAACCDYDKCFGPEE
jgi:nitrogen fixation protein NifQ